MQLIGLEAIYRRPNTSKPNPGHKVYPYLLRGLEINRVSQDKGVPPSLIRSDHHYSKCRGGFQTRPYAMGSITFAMFA